MEATITEEDMDATSKQFVCGLRDEAGALELDLDVDGLSETVVSRLVRILSFRRYR